jgi:hypothetical protein
MHRQPAPHDFDERTASGRTLMISKLFRVPNFKAIIVQSVESTGDRAIEIVASRQSRGWRIVARRK